MDTSDGFDSNQPFDLNVQILVTMPADLNVNDDHEIRQYQLQCIRLVEWEYPTAELKKSTKVVCEQSAKFTGTFMELKSVIGGKLSRLLPPDRRAHMVKFGCSGDSETGERIIMIIVRFGMKPGGFIRPEGMCFYNTVL